MKIDLLGQLIIAIALVLLYCFEIGVTWTNTFWVILLLWQFSSAIHLWYAYRYVQRLNYLKTFIIIAISLPVWGYIVGYWALVPVSGLALWYIWYSIRDTIIVYRRHKPFWELFQ